MKDIAKFFLNYMIRGWFIQQAVVFWKKKTLLLYAKSLEMARKSLIGLLILFFTLQMMCFGLLLAIVTGAWLLPLESELKLGLLCGLGAFLFFVPLGILIYGLSSKVWLEKSGLQPMLDKT